MPPSEVHRNSKPLQMIANRLESVNTMQDSTHEKASTTKTSEESPPESGTINAPVPVGAENIATSAEAMKLVVRSPYWGRILKGKTRRNYDHGSTRSYRVITCQAVLSATEGQYWGCCPHHGKRVLELKEYHFQDCFPGNWDLYMIGSSVAPTYVVHAFFLLPQSQTTIDLDYKIASQGWSYVGTANASVVRMDIEGMLCDILKQNDTIGFRFHHVHLEILMDQVFDRETPRSRKAATDKSRTEQGQPSPDNQLSISDSLSTTTTTTIPPIPRVVSNDASYFSDAPSHATSNTYITQENMPTGLGWFGEATPTTFHHPQTYPMSWPVQGSAPPVQWYPASLPPHHMHHAVAHHHLPPTYNQPHPLMQPHFPPSGSTPLPRTHAHGGFVSAAAQARLQETPSAAGATNATNPAATTQTYANAAARSMAPHPRYFTNMPQEGRDDPDTEFAQQVHTGDQKVCEEEAATASVSETTGDDDCSSHT